MLAFFTLTSSSNLEWILSSATFDLLPRYHGIQSAMRRCFFDEATEEFKIGLLFFLAKWPDFRSVVRYWRLTLPGQLFDPRRQSGFQHASQLSQHDRGCFG
jgi:hypothetical protein